MDRVGKPFPSLQILAFAPNCSAEDVNGAVSSASEAFRSWSRLSGPVRAEHLYRWADAILKSEDALTNAVVDEVGKPIGEARGEVKRCAAILRYFAGEAVRAVGEVIPGQSANSLQYSILRPLGAVGLITPWNFPLAIPLWKAAPALAMGNTVVLKPSEHSCLVASLLAETAQTAGIPAGVFNVIYGDGKAGALLLEHLDVRAISFTGSAAVGARIASGAAARNIKFQTEMGGKNAAIVLKDADLSQAAKLVAGGAMRYAGQKCTATSRVIVERSIVKGFLEALRAATEALTVGDPSEPGTAIGPVITKHAQTRLCAVLDEARADTLYTGAVPGGPLAQGYFVPAAIIQVSDPQCKLAQEELFGPLLAVLEAEDFDHAIDLANGTPFGLSVSLFTQGISSALKYVDRIEAGLVRVNADTTGVDPHAPFGGMKGSSSHVREQGSVAKEFYSEIKTVQIGS